MNSDAMRALDAQVDLIHFLDKNPDADLFHDAFMRSQLEQAGTGETAAPDAGQRMSQIQHTFLNIAETFAVTDDIYRVIDAAAEALPEGQVLEREDLPCGAGFIWLDTPTHIVDVHGDTIAVRALAWSVVNTPKDYAEGYWQESTRRRGYVLAASQAALEDAIGMALFVYTDPSDPADHMHGELANHPLRSRLSPYPMLAFTTSLFGEPESVVTAQERWAYTFFRFIQEPWIGSDRVHPGRPAARRAQRVSLPAEVRVVRLRKTVKSDHSGNHSDVAWSHQWLVRGHWRNQWHPSTQSHKLRWISPYLKGPEDAPLIVKDHVFAVDR